MAGNKRALVTAQWNQLVVEAEEATQIELDEELESYLVFLLMRYHDQPQLANIIVATEYLEGTLQTGELRRNRMRDVGDHCLLYSGLFPRNARRRNVPVDYYIDLGRGAYRNLAEDEQFGLATVFTKLATHFVALMDTLQALRSMSLESPLLDPLSAMELWQKSGSRYAASQIESVTEAGEAIIMSAAPRRTH